MVLVGEGGIEAAVFTHPENKRLWKELKSGIAAVCKEFLGCRID